jgi:hypothetical protein
MGKRTRMVKMKKEKSKTQINRMRKGRPYWPKANGRPIFILTHNDYFPNVSKARIIFPSGKVEYHHPSWSGDAEFDRGCTSVIGSQQMAVDMCKRYDIPRGYEITYWEYL